MGLNGLRRIRCCHGTNGDIYNGQRSVRFCHGTKKESTMVKDTSAVAMVQKDTLQKSLCVVIMVHTETLTKVKDDVAMVQNVDIYYGQRRIRCCHGTKRRH